MTEHLDQPRRALDTRRLPDYRDRMFRAAYAMCGSREDAEDLVQEAYSQVLRRTRFLSHDDDLAYLLRVLRNTWHTTYRKRQRQPHTVLLDDSVDYIADPGGDPGVTVPEVRGLYALVWQLPDPLRDTVIAVDVLGLSYKQAARALRIRPGTVMSRLHRARSTLAQELREADQSNATSNVS